MPLRIFFVLLQYRNKRNNRIITLTNNYLLVKCLMSMKKKIYEPPQLTVVVVKPERGFAVSIQGIHYLGLLFSAESSSQIESRQDAAQDWGEGGWF